MRYLRHVGLAALVLAATASSAVAQRSVNTGGGAGGGGFWELGTDFISFSHTSMTGGNTSTDFGFGSGTVRAGRFLTDVISIEPQLTFNHNSTKTTSTSSSTGFGLEVGLLYHLQSDKTQGQWYVRPLVGISTSSFKFGSGSSNSVSQTVFGVGAGYKMPSMMNKNISVRIEAAFKDYTKDGATPASTIIGVMAGASVFTK